MRYTLVFSLALVVGCGPKARNGDDDVTDANDPECSDGNHRCNATTYQTCSGGHWTTQEDCPIACSDELGCVACQPNTNVCQDGNVHSCDASGMVGPETEACTGSKVCDGGMCVDACMNAAMNKSYIGCEYMAVDLDNAIEVQDIQGGAGCVGIPGIKNVTMQACGNAGNTQVAGGCDPGSSCPGGFTCKSMNVCVLDAQHSPFAIVVSNPQSRAVNVTVTGPGGQTFMNTVPAGAVQALLPQAAPQSIPDQSIDGTGKVKQAYKVTADLPIVAYQFNPLENVNVFSNDASLLIPTTAYDIEYYAISWPTTDRRTPAPGRDSYHGFVSIVASTDTTVVEITPTANVLAGPTQPAIAANTPTMVTLNAFEVLTLQAAVNGDLTGTKVRSVNGTTTFGVFGGHEAMGFGETMAPDATHIAGPCCADHLEEMLFGTSTWGKTFAIARSQSRGTHEPDLLRVMAQKPNTMVTFDPAPASGSCPMLQPGKFCEIKIAADTAITSTEPVLIGHYFESAIWQDPFFGGAVGEGDPSLALAVPTEQYRTEYTVLVPAQYAKNFFSISAPAAGVVQVDGLAVALQPFANGTFRGGRMQVTAGQHKITCPGGCGIEVYGYSDAVSYLFAGGLDLKQIVIN